MYRRTFLKEELDIVSTYYFPGISPKINIGGGGTRRFVK